MFRLMVIVMPQLGEKTMNDVISRQSVRDTIYRIRCNLQMMDDSQTADKMMSGVWLVEKAIKQLPSAQPEPLTDKEQRIFLAAMGREEKVCEEVDRNHVREPYEDSLMSICREIKRKVKGALWGI